MTKGKIVLVPFPFDDLSASKVRPAACLTNPIGTHRHVIISFISSRIPPDPLETDLILDSAQSGFSATGLRATYTLRLHRLMTVAASFFQRELGMLPSDVQKEIQGKLAMLFGG